MSMMSEEINNEPIGRDQLSTTDRSGVVKKLYIKPCLTLYGNVEHITQGAESGNQDTDGQGTSIGGEIPP
jgi:hypothetical protein